MARRPAQPDPTWHPVSPDHNATLLGDLPQQPLGESERTLCPTRPLRTLGCYLLVGQHAVQANHIPDCRVAWLWLLHLPLSSGASPQVSIQQQCTEVLEPRASTHNSAHPGICAESRPLETIPTTGTVPAEILVPADRCIKTGRHPLQPPTAVGTCLAHAFHPDANTALAGQDRRPPGIADA